MPTAVVKPSTRSTQPRKTMEQQLRMMERFGNMQDSDDEADVPPAATQTNAAAKTFTDEELKKKVLEMREEQFGESAKTPGNRSRSRSIKTTSSS